jgi:hypothetical protein
VNGASIAGRPFKWCTFFFFFLLRESLFCLSFVAVGCVGMSLLVCWFTGLPSWSLGRQGFCLGVGGSWCVFRSLVHPLC